MNKCRFLETEKKKMQDDDDLILGNLHKKCFNYLPKKFTSASIEHQTHSTIPITISQNQDKQQKKLRWQQKHKFQSK